jgi:hypothetical protein
MMLRAGALPEAPKVLEVGEKGLDVEVVFVNQLARSQQIQDVSNTQQWVQSLSFLAQLNPEVIDNINVDGIASHFAKVLGVPEIAVQNSDVVEELRQARAQAQQQEAALESASKMADVASKAGNAGEAGV